MKDECRSPAAAYFVMADLLGEGYFRKDPPQESVHVMAVGDDGIATFWRIARAGYQQMTKDALPHRVQMRLVA